MTRLGLSNEERAAQRKIDEMEKQMIQIDHAADELFLRAFQSGELRADLNAGLIYARRFRSNIPRGALNKCGYMVFTLHFGGQRVQVKAHRAIWLAAHNCIPHGLVLDHINGLKSDNRLANLRLATNLENSRNRRSYVGENNPASLVTKVMAAQIAARYARLKSYRKTAKEFAVSASTVANVVRRMSEKLVELMDAA